MALDTRMPQEVSSDLDRAESDAEFVEVDPTGRYGRVSIQLTSNALTGVPNVNCGRISVAA